MKTLHSLPKDKGFFDNYATLIRSVVLAGFFAQIVSGFTEAGAIFTSTKQSLEPFSLGFLGVVAAALVAILATAVIEVGLRKTFPVAVDAILHRRFSGLHLPISVFVWLLSIVLIGASGLLSFHNSKVIVDDFTPPPVEKTTTATDSTYQAETSSHRATFTADSSMIAEAYAARITATATAYDGKIKASTEKLRGYESREQRTGNSFASAKDRTRQQRAELEAEKAEALAALTADKADELTQARANFKALTTTATEERKTAATEIKTANDESEAARLAAVNKYGGGLGWFTVVCLFLFAVSVILDRIHRKGAGIEESVQIEAYDFRPGALLEWWSAISERVNYHAHNRITAFANRTPSAPLPAQPGAVYDLKEALQHVTIKLQLDNQDEEEPRTVFMSAKEPEEDEAPPKRKRIGYTHYDDDDTTSVHYAHETTKKTGSATHESAHEDYDLREAKRRLKMYRKRVGIQEGKARNQEQKNGKVCQRTADAIDNNKQWVDHYQNLINNLQNSSK
jgi:hypothetical protein